METKCIFFIFILPSIIMAADPPDVVTGVPAVPNYTRFSIDADKAAEEKLPEVNKKPIVESKPEKVEETSKPEPPPEKESQAEPEPSSSGKEEEPKPEPSSDKKEPKPEPSDAKEPKPEPSSDKEPKPEPSADEPKPEPSADNHEPKPEPPADNKEPKPEPSDVKEPKPEPSSDSEVSKPEPSTHDKEIEPKPSHEEPKPEPEPSDTETSTKHSYIMKITKSPLLSALAGNTDTKPVSHDHHDHEMMLADEPPKDIEKPALVKPVHEVHHDAPAPEPEHTTSKPKVENVKTTQSSKTTSQLISNSKSAASSIVFSPVFIAATIISGIFSSRLAC